ncbi:cytochrome c oxidase subunit 2A [Paenibacillus puerhi]|uniref:cytochrome c oxidase subunit 2A n=1 Tax=Paenibacillus puerhi TaxID=2692622 RepID=UPI00135B236C|nr:cytochrome c oxidase subunit 2A [Paenibacillus puerhi]
MAKLQDINRRVEKPAKESHNEPVLKGTFAAVMLLGLFLVVSWVGIFLLFIARG